MCIRDSAGTVSETGVRSSRVVTDGGRVLTVVGMGNSLAQARAKAYDRLQQISFHEAHYRMDIGDLEAEERAWSPGPAAAGQS